MRARRGRIAPQLERQAAATELRRLHASDTVALERRRVAHELLKEVRRFDSELAELTTRITIAVDASGTTVTEVFGIGPIMAAYVLGYSGDINRFPSAGRYARYNGTAPIEASSGPEARHRLNPRGNRQLNHAMRMADSSGVDRQPGVHAICDERSRPAERTRDVYSVLRCAVCRSRSQPLNQNLDDMPV